MIADRPVWVTIPTIGKSDLLIPLVNALEEDNGVDKIILTVNLEEYVDHIKEFFQFGEPNIEVIESWPMGRSLYCGWNVSLEMARAAGAWLAVLNDDIILHEPSSISSVARLLAASPSYAVAGLNWQERPERTPRDAPSIRKVHGTYRHYGVGGFAWVCDPCKVVDVPEDLVHWGGDDFLMFRAEDAGYKVGIASHIHVEHPAPETTSATQHWTYEARQNDRQVFERYYPGKGW